ncbi:contactin-5-like [Haliotis asinina]|uniref:contactin-5-like n=1 Tax=Haliotis asinina TaxID=109174 RepID=UPI00353191D9
MMGRRGVSALILMIELLGQADSVPRVSEPRLRSTRYIRPGSNVVLSCSAEGSQMFRFIWMKYGQRIHVSTGQYGPLTIENFTQHNQGHYTCRVDDGEGYDVSPTVSLLLAQLDDQWNVPVRNVMKNEMSPMSLTCDHPPFSLPPGKYSWFRIEGKRSSQVKTSNRIMIDNYGTLRFAFAEVDDGGIYRCGIHNTVLDFTKLGSEVNITVKANPSARHLVNLTGGLRPNPMSFITTTTVVLGKEARLECFFSGMPTPTVTWSRNGLNAKVDLKDTRTLTIRNVQESDGGKYTCSGMNSMGKVSETLQLNVVYKYSGPIWEKKPITQNVSEGQDVTFVCTARAIGPTSSLATQWIHDLGTDRRGISLSHDKAALTFHSVSGGSDCVTCNVSNNIDFISETVCYKVIKSSPSLLIIVICCTVLVAILTTMAVMFFVLYKKVVDLGNMRFRLPSISSRYRRSTTVTATAGKSTGYLELETLPSRFSAATEWRLLSEAFKQHQMDAAFHPVRKSVSHNFLRDTTRIDMNETDLRPITRYNSDSCVSNQTSYIHPNYNVRRSNHMFGNHHFSERYEEAQNGESLGAINMDRAGWTHNCGIHEDDKRRSDGRQKTTRFCRVPRNTGQRESRLEMHDERDMATCFDKGSDG